MSQSLQRGYLPDGKDRQHPVQDPYASTAIVTTPLVWFNPGSTKTWYETVGMTTDFPPTIIPEPVPDNV